MVREDLIFKVCTDLICTGAGNTKHLWCEISTKDECDSRRINMINMMANCST